MLDFLVFGRFLDLCIVRPKSLVLTPQLAMPSSLFLHLSMISGRNALFSMFTPDEIIRLYVSGRYFSVISDCFWFIFPQIFWNWNIKVFADVPVDYFTNTVVSLCVQLF